MRFLLIITILFSVTSYAADRNEPKYKEAISTATRAAYKASGLESFTFQSLKALEGKAKRTAIRNNAAFVITPVGFMARSVYRKRIEMHYKDFTLETKKDMTSRLVFEVQF